MRIIPILLLFPLLVTAQQLPVRSPFGSTNFAWNPAMTAPERYWEAGVAHRQEWLGFEQAPRTSLVYGQYAVPREPISIGGFFMLDKIYPLRTNLIGMTYAYKIGQPRRRSRRRGVRQHGQLSLGVMAMMQHIIIDPLDQAVNDPDDPLLPSGERDKFRPNVGAGLYYMSRPTGPDDASYFFAGAGVNQLLNSRITFLELSPTANLQRAFHGNATLGYHYGGEQLHWEPSLWLSVAGSNIIDLQFSLLVEKPAAFWAGVTYNQGQTVGVQLGHSIGGGDDTGLLRIGALGSYNIGSFGKARGVGFEFYVAYRMEP